MNTSTLMRAGQALTLVVLVSAAGACRDDRITLFQPVGPPVINFNLGPAAVVPAGAVSRIVSPDPSIPNDSTVRVVVRNLATLSGGVYQVWLTDSALTTVRGGAGVVVAYRSFLDLNLNRFTGVDTLATLDSTFNPPTAVTIASANDTTLNGYDSLRIDIRQSGLGVNPRPFYNVVISVETAPAAQPGNVRFLWRRENNGALGFGSFGGADRSSDIAFPGTIPANGRGGFRGDEVSVDMFEIPRPPIGFAYEGWLVGAADTVRLGDLTTGHPDYVSLRNADTDTGQPNTSPTAILSANVRAFAGEIGLSGAAPYQVFATFQLSLTSKLAGPLAPSSILTGAVPDIIKGGGGQ